MNRLRTFIRIVSIILFLSGVFYFLTSQPFYEDKFYSSALDLVYFVIGALLLYKAAALFPDKDILTK